MIKNRNLQYKQTTMRLLNLIFGKKELKYLSESDIEQSISEFNSKYEKTKNIFLKVLKNYNSEYCQCAFPRFQQIIGIDCLKTGKSFKCWETELLINLSKEYFTIEKSELTDECENKIWRCKKCDSKYEYGWTDLSRLVERQKLKLINLKTKQIGEPIITPIPLFLGVRGHSLTEKTEIINVEFAEFEKYITEK